MAVSRPTEVLLSYEMDGIITLKSGIPSFCYLVPAKNGREEAITGDFPVHLDMRQTESDCSRGFSRTPEMF